MVVEVSVGGAGWYELIVVVDGVEGRKMKWSCCWKEGSKVVEWMDG